MMIVMVLRSMRMMIVMVLTFWETSMTSMPPEVVVDADAPEFSDFGDFFCFVTNNSICQIFSLPASLLFRRHSPESPCWLSLESKFHFCSQEEECKIEFFKFPILCPVHNRQMVPMEILMEIPMEILRDFPSIHFVSCLGALTGPRKSPPPPHTPQNLKNLKTGIYLPTIREGAC